MKASRVVACLLFPHTSSKLAWSRLMPPPPAPCYTIGGTSTLKLGRLTSFLASPPFSAKKIQLQRHWRVRFQTGECVGEPPTGSSIPSSFTQSTQGCSINVFFLFIFSVFLSKLGDGEWVQSVSGVIKVCCSFFHMSSFSPLCCKYPILASSTTWE